jgi:hypothetical protein
MTNASKRLVAFSLGLTLGLTALASPSFAQREEHMNSKRATAVHDCSMKAQKLPQSTWGEAQGHMYRSCMMEHGEQE